MTDMSSVIVPKSDQINADDLIGGPMTIRISGVDIRPGTEQPVTIHYDGDDGRPWKPCKSMSRVLVAAWGPDAKVYVGRRVTLYRDPSVKWGGMEVGGIRVSAMSHIEREMVLALTATKGSRKPYRVTPLRDEPTQDRAAQVVAGLLERIAAASTLADMQALTAEEVVEKQRGWLAEKRPKLAQQVDAAVLARIEALSTNDGWPGPDVAAEGRGA